VRNRGRTKLKFQKPQLGDDGFGSNTAAGGWGDDINIGVLLMPSRGNEAEFNGAVEGRQTYDCEIRAHYAFSNPKIDTTWRAVHEETGRVFNISAVAQKDSDLRWVKLTITVGEPN
jgi:head-tail adaptor